MWPYWLLFAVAAWGVIGSRPLQEDRRENLGAWLGFGVLLSLMIGFRYEVGGDWVSYVRMLERVQDTSLFDAIKVGDPGYSLTNWVFADTGLNVWSVNLVCGAIFSFGMIALCRRQPIPWLAALVAVPYFVVVVAMGYSRQAVAIGLAMLALVSLQDRSIVRFVIWLTLAALFHKTAVLLIPIGILASTQNKIWAAILVGTTGVLLYLFLLEPQLDRIVAGYIAAEYQSQGAAIRVAMNALPALAFLISRHRFQLAPQEKKLWTYMALGGLAFVVLLAVSPSSTLVDRMALYVIPLQLFILSRLPIAWAQTGRQYRHLVFGVLMYSAAVLFVWLNFAAHAHLWLPYQLFPIDRLTGLG